jgi:hypothetical protein
LLQRQILEMEGGKSSSKRVGLRLEVHCDKLPFDTRRDVLGVKRLHLGPMRREVEAELLQVVNKSLPAFSTLLVVHVVQQNTTTAGRLLTDGGIKSGCERLARFAVV